MNRISLYVTAPPFLHVTRPGDDRPELGAILLADVADRPATSEELRDLFRYAAWCPVCVLLRAPAERRRIPRSPRICSVSTLDGAGGRSIVDAVRGRPRPEPVEMAEWLAERVRLPGLRAPLATLFCRAISDGGRVGFGSTWSESPVASLGTYSAVVWQEVARLADLAANHEAVGRQLVRRNPGASRAIRAIEELLGANEDQFRERAGWEWVLEAALRRSRAPSSPGLERTTSAPVSSEGALAQRAEPRAVDSRIAAM